MAVCVCVHVCVCVCVYVCVCVRGGVVGVWWGCFFLCCRPKAQSNIFSRLSIYTVTYCVCLCMSFWSTLHIIYHTLAGLDILPTARLT